MIYILAAIIAIVVLGICITRKPYDEKPGVSGGVGNGNVEMPEYDKDNEEEFER